VLRKASDWLERNRGHEDFYLHLDIFDPHEPWDPPEPFWSMYDPDYDGQELIDPVPGAVDGYLTPEELAHTFALYQGEVTFVDKWIGILLDQIEGLGLFENSLIMHVTDHGEPFGEHGIVRKARPFNYTELVHMPWVIYHPEGIGNGVTVPAIVQPTDLLPTVLDVLGIAPDLELRFLAPQETGSFPQNAVTATRDIKLHGHSLLPLMAGEIDSVRDYAYIGHHAQSWTIRDQAWSYHLFIDGNRPPELYYVADDWWEQANVIEEHPDRAAHMELELRRFVAGLD
jgi:arylsulfatase A-like enzyme